MACQGSAAAAGTVVAAVAAGTVAGPAQGCQFAGETCSHPGQAVAGAASPHTWRLFAVRTFVVVGARWGRYRRVVDLGRGRGIGGIGSWELLASPF